MSVIGRPRSSMAGSTSGLPTPGHGGGASSTRRKSNIGSSPMQSPSKSGSSEIASQMAELQAAIRKKDPASFSRPSSVLSLNGDNDDDDAGEEVLASPEPSPRKVHSTVFAASRSSISRPTSNTLRKPSNNGNVDYSSPARSGTPTTPGGQQRPPSSLSSSSYMSANTHASASLSRARTPASAGAFATPGRTARPSDAANAAAGGGFLHTSTRTKTPRASSAYAAHPPLSAGLQPEVGDNVRALGMEGVLRYTGDVEFKPGTWAGIQLTGQYEGKGKNNGTVQGVQYFACPENCGIFVQSTKVESSMPPPPLPLAARPSSSLGMSATGPTPRKVLPRPSLGSALVPPSTVTRAASKSSTEASQVAAARITAGSRASSYLNLTAKDLRAMREGGQSSAASGTTIRGRGGSSSPTKLGASTASSSTGAENSGITPKATRTARPSMGGAGGGLTAGTTTPGPAGRKSFGGPGTPTPGNAAAAAASLRRPASSMRSHTPDIPSVPPIPANLAASATGPSTALSKEATASTPSAARRYSQLSRPSTPGIGRPSSRMSNASGMRSVSRASSRASMTSSRLGYNRDDLGTSTTDATSSGAPHNDISTELVQAREALQRATREAEQAKLELLEMDQDLKEERKRARALHIEVNDLKRQAASSRLDEASAVDSRAEEAERHFSALSSLQLEIETLKNELVVLQAAKSENEASSAARLAGADASDRAREAAERERERLEAELTSLQSAGRQAIEIYQDKVDALEAQLFEQEAATAAARAEARSAANALAASTSAAATTATSPRLEDHSPEALLAASMGASNSAQMQRDEVQESALAIENDSLRSELEHQKTRFHRLEEELEDAKLSLEQESEKLVRRGKESLELAEKLKRELKEMKEGTERLRSEREQLQARSRELENALSENRQTLEAERWELEILRKESGDRGLAKQEGASDLADQEKDLLRAQRERDDALAEARKLKEDLEALQEELKLMEELKSDDNQIATPAKAGASAEFQQQLATRDAEIKTLQDRLREASQSSLPHISTEPTDTDTMPDSDRQSSSRAHSPNSLSPSANMRSKRNSNVSSASSSASSNSANKHRSPLKDGQDKAADEIRGFKILLDQANAENSRLSSTNQDLISEAAKLRDAQRALEKTVAGLLDQLDDQSPFKGSGGATSAGTAGNQRTLGQDTLEAELAETKKKLKDLERGHEREKTALNSEVAQLESLVEAKIFREDELEQQLADTRKALADIKSRMGGANGAGFERHQRDTKATIRATESSNGRRSASAHSDTDDDDGKCELCGDPHGIEDCPIFAGSAISPELQQTKAYPNDIKKKTSNEPFCDDCEEYGHDLNNCPLANEVF